jgi:hypothetical protein
MKTSSQSRAIYDATSRDWHEKKKKTEGLSFLCKNLILCTLGKAVRRAMAMRFSVSTWFGGLLMGCGGGGKRLGGKHMGRRGSRVRDKIARVEASLRDLDTLREDRSVLVFDWDNCDSVEHESLRNSFRNTLLDDIRDQRSTVDSFSWRGIRARIKAHVRRNTTDKSSRCIENWLDDVPAAPQHCGRLTPTNSSSGRTASGVDGKETRRVGLLIWPPEIIAHDVPSCYKDRIHHRTLADSSAHGRHAKNQLQSNASCSSHHNDTFIERSKKTSADSPLDDRGVSAVELLLESRKEKDHSIARMALAWNGRGILLHQDAE